MAEMQTAGGESDNQVAHQSSMIEQNSVLCNAEADEYFMSIKGELNQVDRLVSDAVNNLVINFGYISKLTKSHHDMVLAIERMAAPEGGSKPILELLEKQMIIADKIEQELEMVVTSLQFGDLVTQLLAHTSRQVEALNIELQRMERQRSWRECVGKNKLDTIHEGVSKAANMAKTKSKRKPVVQQGMQMGDIELF